MSTILRRRRSFAVLAAAMLGLGVASVAIPQAAYAGSANFTATEDSYTSQSSPTSTHCCNSLNNNAGPTAERRAFVKFVVSGIPVGATNITSTLQLWSQSGDTTHTFTANQEVSTWTEAGLTWNNQPALGTAIITKTGLTNGATNSWNLGTGYITGNGTYSVAITTNDPTTVFYNSRESAGTKPTLAVTWTDPAPQSPPAVTTGAASSITSTTATLNGTVNPNGASTTYHFEYGPTTAYGTSIPVPDGSAGAGTTAVNESANITGLTASTLYHYRLVATNSGGTTNGADATFTTSAVQAAPTVTTGAASSVATTTATLNGTVNPNGASTTYHFEYGPTTAYGTLIPVPDGSAGTGTTAVNESANLTGLTANTVYHVRLDATNSGGTTNGADATFTTTSQAVPTVTTGAATAVATTTVTLNGTVNPNGSATTCHFDYGLTTTYGSATANDGSPGSGTTVVNVTASVTGLTASTLYHFRLNCSNSGGSAQGSDATFTTAVASILDNKSELKCTEIGEWQVSSSGSPTTVDPVASLTNNAGFNCIRIAVPDCFIGTTCGTNNHAGTVDRTAFNTMIQRIRDSVIPVTANRPQPLLWFKLLPTSHDYPDTTTATSFCPPWTGAADGNLVMYKDQVNQIKTAGWSGPLAIELSNEMYFDCTSGTTGPWDVQSGTNLGGGSVGVSNRVGQHFAANAGPLKTYAQGLGFGEVVVGDDIGVPGGAQWGQSFVTDANGPFGYTWTYSTRWIDEFNNGDKNALGITPDFEAWHSYVHSPDNYAAAPYESTLGDPNSATDDDQILYSYVRGQIGKYRTEVNTIWGATAGNPIRFAISEGAAGSANSGGTWSGWTTGTRAPDFYSGWLNMLAGDGNLTGTGTRFWEYTVFCDACNSSAPGNDYDVIKPDGTTSNYYSTFSNFVP